LLKWRYQEARRSRSWTLSTKEQREETSRILRANPSLRPELPDAIEDAYRSARIAAARETKLPEKTFPDLSPFNHDALMSDPVEWSGSEPQRRSSTRNTKA
jgi:hypothetical protein